jgi:DNA-binding NarL/FixJ family response regulator
MVRVGVAKVLGDAGMRVVAEPADGVSAVAALRAHRPDVLVVGRVDVGPADLIARALVLVPELKCVALAAGSGPADLRPLLAAGAHGVVSRAVDPAELLDVLRRVLGGDRVVSPVLLPRMFDDGGSGPARAAGEDGAARPGLTGRERQIMRLLGAGRSNAEIASTLFVSAATVKTHLAHIYGKLGVRGRYEAVGRAVALGLLD